MEIEKKADRLYLDYLIENQPNFIDREELLERAIISSIENNRVWAQCHGKEFWTYIAERDSGTQIEVYSSYSNGEEIFDSISIIKQGRAINNNVEERKD